MSKPQPEEDLAAIVRSGASSPVKKVITLVIVGGLIAGGAFYFFKQKDPQAGKPTYVTSPAEKTDIAIIVTASGNLAPTNKIIVGSELSGLVAEIFVDTNDVVKKGQELLRLDTSKLQQQTHRSRANLLSAKAQLSLAEATLEEEKATLTRQEELLELSGGKTPSRAIMAATRASVARAEATVENAKASIAASEADVGSYESDLEKAIIRSPVDGMVLARSIEIGQTVAASFTAPTLFTIAEDLTTMELVVSVSEADIGKVKEGQTASFSVDAWPGRTYTASVKKVAFGSAALTAAASNAAATPTGGVVTYETELSVGNEDLSLRPGMTATVDIAVVDEKDILSVPNAALRFDPAVYEALNAPDKESRTLVENLAPGGRRFRGAFRSNRPGASEGPPTVWTMKNGTPSKIELKTGVSDGHMTQVLEGDLEPGTELITSIEHVTP